MRHGSANAPKDLFLGIRWIAVSTAFGVAMEALYREMPLVIGCVYASRIALRLGFDCCLVQLRRQLSFQLYRT